MEAGDKDFIGREHIEDVLARSHRFFFVVVHLEMPFWTLHRHYVLRARVSGNYDALSLAFDMKRQQTRRMARGIDRGNAGDNLVARLDKLRAVRQRNADLYK